MDNKNKIVAYLGKKLEKRFTMHELSGILSIPYASFYRTVLKMKDLLVIESIGRAKVLSLNLENPVILGHLMIASDEERKEFLARERMISVIAREIKGKDIVALFGSYAKGNYSSRSDIDLLIISRKGRKTISFSKFEILFKKKINPIFVTKQEFKKMLKADEENLGKQVLKGHILLNNIEGFWESVLRCY